MCIENYLLVYSKQPSSPAFPTFKEVENVMKMFNDITHFNVNLLPDLILVNGNGFHHSNRFALAFHLAVLTNLPALGCNQTVFAVYGLNKLKISFHFGIG